MSDIVVLADFPNGTNKALAMSYDDGVVADKRLIDIFNRNGIKGTFHLNAGLTEYPNRITQAEAAEIYAGHEVSAHAHAHPSLIRCPKEQVLHEMLEDRRKLERMTGCPVRGMSYPYGAHNSRIREMLPHLGFRYARSTQPTHSFSLPEDWFEWKPTCHHRDSGLESLADTFAAPDRGQHLKLMYVWGHSYEFDNNGNWDLIERFCERLGGREDIWYASSIEIVDYLDSFRRLHFSADRTIVYNPSAATVWLRVNGRSVEAPGGQLARLLPESG